MTIYHGGTVESDRYGYVEFVDMQSAPVLWLCGSVGELCEIGYEEAAAMFGRGCASGVS